MCRCAAYERCGDIEGPRRAIVRELYTNEHANTEADTDDRDRQLPGMAQIKPQ
jgi:hypothetical protein